MKNICVFPNEEKDKDLKITKLLVDRLKDAGASVMMPEEKADIIGRPSLGIDKEHILNNAELIISVGGDGTFLSVARKVWRYEIPILGINAGNLGFLTEVDKNDIEQVTGLLINGNFKIENRMILETKVVYSDEKESEPYFSFNDVVISRRTISRMINLKIILDDKMVDRFPADGIIISTPTGSTAYSLSAGGPLIEPDLNLMVITPICPHILHARSMVISDKKKVSIAVEDKHINDSMLTIDGQQGIALSNAQKVDIVNSDYTLKVVRLMDKNFYDIVKDKLFDRNGRR